MRVPAPGNGDPIPKMRVPAPGNGVPIPKMRVPAPGNGDPIPESHPREQKRERFELDKTRLGELVDAGSRDFLDLDLVLDFDLVLDLNLYLNRDPKPRL